MTKIVGIVGAGTMGSGIAQVCLGAGLRVVLHDADAEALLAGRARVVDGLGRWAAKGTITPAEREAAEASLSLADGLEDLADEADLVIEAVVEQIDAKQAIFSRLDALTSADTVLASNSSSLSIETIARATRRPERVIGLHFFNPAPLMALVEVVTTARTNGPSVEAAGALVGRLGKTAVRCADAPGFIVNRVGRAYVIEAVRMLEAGQGTVASIDAALTGAGYPMGPFQLADLIGLDVDLSIDEVLDAGLDDAGRFRVPELQAGLVAEGRLGRKTERGFYRYADGRAVQPDVEAPTHDPGAGEPLDDGSVVERLELAIINEAYRVVEEGVASPPDVDTAMRLGAGHPMGPFELVDELGLRHIVTRLHALHTENAGRSGDQYEVAASLWQMATV